MAYEYEKFVFNRDRPLKSITTCKLLKILNRPPAKTYLSCVHHSHVVIIFLYVSFPVLFSGDVL